jgi:hypothetical protein
MKLRNMALSTRKVYVAAMKASLASAMVRPPW